MGGEPLRIDAAKEIGRFKPLHGVNGGPLNYGETIDLTDAWRAAGIPITRLHDCEWPSGRIADFHAIFPDLKADPRAANSYRFTETDAYLRAIAAAGSHVVFRLGESIEHSQTKIHVNPPADFERWTAACCGIVRYYDQRAGKDGFPKIDYWEIWNEPENQPAMWTGTNEQFYQLYSVVSRGLKREFPHLKIGGPALGATGEVKDGKFIPNDFLRGFMTRCREEKLPLDFFSWHTYTNEPAQYGVKAKAIRTWLDQQDYQKSELHLNEWNYLPRNDWSAIARSAKPAERTRWFEQQGSAEGAAFAAYVLLDLQDAPLDMANYFAGDTGPFGLFERYGEPKPTYYAFQTFHQLQSLPRRVAVTGSNAEKMIAAAGLSSQRDEFRILIANVADVEPAKLEINNLDWADHAQIEVCSLTASSKLPLRWETKPNLESVTVPAAPAVFAIRLRKSKE